MTSFNIYSEDGIQIGTINEPINRQNIGQYFAEHGIERLQGYSDAISDVLAFFRENLSTTAGAKAKIIAFYDDKHDLNEVCKSFINTRLLDL